ncbi:MAG: type I restriction-modification system subunit M N-terminal domain-containing protein [Planctomycetes bacterium]|nr:type I restriction-modification system subunit M N-terminal domain-containing protein [Planctomycetota bacterium]
MARRRNGNGNGNGRRLATQQSVDQAVKSICDIMRRGNCAGAMQYVPELTWILFLRILDEREQIEEQEHYATSIPFRPSLEAPYRWRDWAAPPAGQANKRAELQDAPQNAFFNFVNMELLPHLKALKTRPDAAPGHQGDGPGHRPEHRRHRVRSRLRHGRLRRAELRAHQEQARQRCHGRAVGDDQAADFLGSGKGEPDLPDCPGESGAARDRQAQHLARQHADRPGDLLRQRYFCSRWDEVLADGIFQTIISGRFEHGCQTIGLAGAGVE